MAVLSRFPTRSAASEVAGVNPDQLAKYVDGRAKPPFEVIFRLTSAKGISLDWLATGNGAPGDADLDDRFVSIPRYQLRAGAGENIFATDEEPADLVKFSRELLRKHGIRADTSQLIESTGDSMVPTIGDGDLMLVDTSEREARDAVFVVRRGGALLVKRLQRHADGSLSLISDNRAYDPDRLPRDDADNLEIVGRVKWVFRSA